MSEPLVLASRSGAVQTLTLNRPAALNSFTTELHAQLLAALNAAASDASVRCVVLTGAGRGFCAGQDLADPAVAPDTTPGAPAKDLGDVVERFYAPLCLRLRSMPVPVVAAVNGVAAGAGADWAEASSAAGASSASADSCRKERLCGCGCLGIWFMVGNSSGMESKEE
jgi:2-(1,2-epoxy-1,2-dihydrophenyl)acetyl-CoA isomerase